MILVQDYLTWKEWSYERLDGSVRSQERQLSVQQFQKDEDTFVFLLSTRAGGIGLNLTSGEFLYVEKSRENCGELKTSFQSINCDLFRFRFQSYSRSTSCGNIPITHLLKLIYMLTHLSLSLCILGTCS